PALWRSAAGPGGVTLLQRRLDHPDDWGNVAQQFMFLHQPAGARVPPGGRGEHAIQTAVAQRREPLPPDAGGPSEKAALRHFLARAPDDVAQRSRRDAIQPEQAESRRARTRQPNDAIDPPAG